MKARAVTYWISTVLLSGMMAFFACLYLIKAPKIMAVFAHLGYPPYFAAVLGVAKLIGVVALLMPRAGLVKEWAYAGFAFTFVGAFISHLASGDGLKALPAVISLVLLGVSYFARPMDRTVVDDVAADRRMTQRLRPAPGF